jgi:hypothetical protein
MRSMQYNLEFGNHFRICSKTELKAGREREGKVGSSVRHYV